jgi:hypothetical protein
VRREDPVRDGKEGRAEGTPTGTGTRRGDPGRAQRARGKGTREEPGPRVWRRGPWEGARMEKRGSLRGSWTPGQSGGPERGRGTRASRA